MAGSEANSTTESQRLRKREELLSEVEAGRLTPEAAENEATLAGLGALVPNVPVEDFDPATQKRWTLLMALVWVLARNLTAVRNSWNDYVTSQYRWTSASTFISAGPRRLERRRPQWVHEIRPLRAGDFAFEKMPGRSFSASMTKLRLALSNGSVRAWGRDLRQGIRSDMAIIPAENWDALQVGLAFTVSGDGQDGLHFGDGIPVYVDLMVERAELVDVFPGDSANDGAEASSENVDPLLQVTDREESAADYKKRIRVEAIRSTFPDGKPGSMSKKVRDGKLDAAVAKLDPDMGPTDPREWRRLWLTVHDDERQ